MRGKLSEGWDIILWARISFFCGTGKPLANQIAAGL
jgi:hypothetical protein